MGEHDDLARGRLVNESLRNARPPPMVKGRNRVVEHYGRRLARATNLRKERRESDTPCFALADHLGQLCLGGLFQEHLMVEHALLGPRCAELQFEAAEPESLQ